MILLGARPGHGKTLLGLELVTRAKTVGRTGFFFTFDFNERDVAESLSNLGFDQSPDSNAVIVDTSDEISADHIISRLDQSEGRALVVIDYLQLLDQRRTNPSLESQAKSLRAYTKDTGAICVLISQIDRSFDMSGKSMPDVSDVSDVRLPNPLDLSIFDRACFLNDGAVHLGAAA